LGKHPTDEELAQTILQLNKEKEPETVEQLVNATKEKLRTPEKEIVKAILKLQNEGKIKLTQQPQKHQQPLATYVRTGAALWYWTTIALSITTAAVVFLIPENLYPWIYTRYVLGTIFILWLPGYTFIKALFPQSRHPKTTEKNLDPIERVALSLGLSLALVPMIGLLLNYTPWGIRLTPIVLSLLSLTITFATAAILREHQTQTKNTKTLTAKTQNTLPHRKHITKR